MTEGAEAPEAWITVGRIVAAQGMAGEVRVYPESDFPERFLVPGDRWLRRSGQTQPEPVQLQRGRYPPSKNLYVVKFQGIDYRDQAEALRDAELLVSQRDRPTLEDGEFHVMDLVGLAVFLQETGELIGHVVDLLSVGNDLLEVELIRPLPEELPEELPEAPPEAIPEAGPDAASPDGQPAGPGNDAAAATFTRRKGRRKAARERKKAARPAKSPRLLVPFVHAIVPVVDLEARRIEITPPPGLLDLSR
ncbi:MAG: ribosome maturation factor RimM [Synechococcales cyanobacterium RM1_1_8]|nr:ribosome maturation factor RimM [Synechococcales cyanobacterium RM1_1_8]